MEQPNARDAPAHLGLLRRVVGLRQPPALEAQQILPAPVGGVGVAQERRRLHVVARRCQRLLQPRDRFAWRDAHEQLARPQRRQPCVVALAGRFGQLGEPHVARRGGRPQAPLGLDRRQRAQRLRALRMRGDQPRADRLRLGPARGQRRQHRELALGRVEVAALARQRRIGLGRAGEVAARQQRLGGARLVVRLAWRRRYRLRVDAVAQDDGALVDARLGQHRVAIAWQPPAGGRQRAPQQQLERVERDLAGAAQRQRVTPGVRLGAEPDRDAEPDERRRRRQKAVEPHVAQAGDEALPAPRLQRHPRRHRRLVVPDAHPRRQLDAPGDELGAQLRNPQPAQARAPVEPGLQPRTFDPQLGRVEVAATALKPRRVARGVEREAQIGHAQLEAVHAHQAEQRLAAAEAEHALAVDEAKREGQRWRLHHCPSMSRCSAR